MDIEADGLPSAGSGPVSESRYVVRAGWNDVPHLDEKTKRELLASTPPFLRQARAEGIPSLGSGAIYPIQWEEVSVPPFAIPPFWRRAYGMDVGWNKTAAIWLAEDPVDKTLYATSEHYRGQAVPAIHAAAIKARGDWIRGAIDPASRGRQQKDGDQLFAAYTVAGLKITKAPNAVEAGLYKVWELLETGRLKFFSTLQATAAEYRLYHRKDGKVVKTNDHALDALRYGVMSFDTIARVMPALLNAPTGRRAADGKAGY